VSSIKLTADSGGGTFEIKAPSSGSNTRVLTVPDTGDATFLTSLSSVGKILQVVSTNKTDTFSASIGKQSFSGAAISVNITPSNSSNKIILVAKLTIGLESDNDIGFAYFKAGSVITGATADASGSAARLHSQTFSTHSEQQHNVMGFYVDTAGGTSQITYDCRLRHGNNSTSGHTIYLNRDHSNGTGDMEQNSMSTLTAIEVAA
tara:strand:- start:82 stop:696 length:615 start_codon:yes stop_codon:yes gene_type:complete